MIIRNHRDGSLGFMDQENRPHGTRQKSWDKGPVPLSQFFIFQIGF